MDGQDYKHFGRLAALLLALADLAERAGGARVPVRCLVLWILRRAHAVALDYAIEAAGSPFLLVACQPTDDTPDDASRLAGNLRALAVVFRTLAHRALLAQEPPGAPRALLLLSRRRAADHVQMATEWSARAPDTS